MEGGKEVLDKSKKYFVAKCVDFDSLRRCTHSNLWACRDRVKPPHPRDLIQNGIDNGQEVILIFSVNNCHGWHGYASVLNRPRSEQVSERQNNHEEFGVVHSSNGESKSCKTKSDIKDQSRFATDVGTSSGWYYFNVHWSVHFLQDFGERCLPSEETKNLKLCDGSPVNMARNWQELSPDSGRILCGMIDGYYQKLVKDREEKERTKEENQPPAFFEGEDKVEKISRNWVSILDKAEVELGNVLLACPCGSQRYNLDTASSDMDMFMVYQAPTSQVLGFNPPKPTIQSGEKNGCDYIIHEVYKYCELLRSGDHRCIETLFLNPTTLVRCSEAMELLKKHRELFLNSKCLEKYLRDACGSRGTKLLEKLTKNMNKPDTIDTKISKLGYVIVRLLQNALDIVEGRPLIVYRPEDSSEKQLLMTIRKGNITIEELWIHINKLLCGISSKKDKVPCASEKVSSILEDWLLGLRFNNFKQCKFLE